MARDVKQSLKQNLDGATVYIHRIIYPAENGGGETVLGPYFNKPKFKKWRAQHGIREVVDEYTLVKKP